MKNKATVYVLGVLVAGVWGLIIYNVIKATAADDTPIATSPVTVRKEPMNDYALKPDTAKLYLNYRDPFGLAAAPKDTVRATTKSVSANKTEGRGNSIFTPAAINWNFIRYSGYIRNPHTRKLIAIVNINGKGLMMSEGETAEQVKLIKNLRDSIRVSYQNKTKFIVINTNNQ